MIMDLYCNPISALIMSGTIGGIIGYNAVVTAVDLMELPEEFACLYITERLMDGYYHAGILGVTIYDLTNQKK